MSEEEEARTRWTGHQGDDYTVVMAPGENTENASISIHTGDRQQDDDLAIRVRDLLNWSMDAGSKIAARGGR